MSNNVNSKDKGRKCIFSKIYKDDKCCGNKNKHHRIGIIMSESRDGTCYRIQWDNMKGIQGVHKSFIEIVDDNFSYII